MATKPPPPPRKGNLPKTSKKGDPPKATETRSNLHKPEPGKTVDMNFKVPAEFKRDFKITAAIHGITQKDLLIEIFREWSKKNG